MKLSTYILLTMAVGIIQMDQSRANNSTDTLYAYALHPYGRYRLNERKEIELISSAVHVGFTFRGEQCAVYASNRDEHQHNYIQYELDGVYQRRLRIDGHPAAPVIITAVGKGPHTIWIYKATEAHTGPVILSKIVADHIRAVSVAKAPLIEFIGNSITCGAASDTSDFPCGTGEYHDHHNAFMAYGPRVARALKTNYILSSVSGIGIYRTWNMEGPSMPQVYENIDFQPNNPEKWDFKKYTPGIVSIALGTNDLSNGDGKHPRAPFDKQVFITDYVGFVKLVKTKYPKAQIVLLSSPMVKGNAREVLENCLATIKSQVDAAYPSDKPVELFFFAPMNAHGCDGHPSVEDHKILAGELQPFFQKLLSE